MPLGDIFYQIGWFPQDDPPGPIIPAVEPYEGEVDSRIYKSVSGQIDITVDVGTPTPIGDQMNQGPPAASPPPNNPSDLPGYPQPIGPIGPVIIPPTFFLYP